MKNVVVARNNSDSDDDRIDERRECCQFEMLAREKKRLVSLSEAVLLEIDVSVSKIGNVFIKLTRNRCVFSLCPSVRFGRPSASLAALFERDAPCTPYPAPRV